MSTTLVKYASSNAADGSLTGWTTPTGTYVDDGFYATREGTVKNTWYGTLFGFDLSSLPDVATLISVTLEAQWHNSAADTSGPVFLLGAKSGGSEVGSGTTDTSGQLADETVQYAPAGLTIANLKATGANGFWAILRFRRTDNTAHVASCDYVKCTVVYNLSLTIQDVAQTQSIESPVLTQHNVLAVDNVVQVQAVDSFQLGVGLVISNVTQTQVIEELVLTAHEAAIQLDIDNVIQTQAVESPALTQYNVLAIDNVVQTQSIDVPTLVQHNILTIADVSQSQVAGGLDLVQHHVLAVQDVEQTQNAGTLDLTQHHVLAINDVVQEQVVDASDLTQHNILIIADVVQMQEVGEPTLAAHGPAGTELEIQNVTQAQSVENLDL